MSRNLKSRLVTLNCILTMAVCGSLASSIAYAAPLEDLDFDVGEPAAKDDLKVDEEPPPERPPENLSVPARPELESGETSNDALQIARQAFQQKKFRRCLELLVVAAAQHPSLPPPRLVMADMYLHNNMRQSGRQLMEQVAIEDAEHPELYRLFGSLALAERRWTEAIMHFQRALELPMPLSWKPEQKHAFVISTKKGLAAAAERRGDWLLAADVLGSLAQIAPADSLLRDRYASALFNAHRREKAYEQFRISYLRNNKMSPAELSMGIMYVNEKDYRQADLWFARAAAAHTTNPTVHFQIAVALMVQDRAQDSARHSATAAQLGLDSPDLNMVRGYASRQLQVYDAAEKFFRDVLKAKPEDTAAKNQLALVLVERSDAAKQQEALRIAGELAEQRDNSANAQATLAWVLYRTGKVEEAETLFGQAIENPSIGPESLYLAARAFADQGNDEKADAAAAKLAINMSRPGIYVLRPVAGRWLQERATN